MSKKILKDLIGVVLGGLLIFTGIITAGIIFMPAENDEVYYLE